MGFCNKKKLLEYQQLTDRQFNSPIGFCNIFWTITPKNYDFETEVQAGRFSDENGSYVTIKIIK